MIKDLLKGKLLQCPLNLIKRDFHDANGRAYQKYKDAYCRYCMELDKVKSCVYDTENPEPIATMRECKIKRKKPKLHEL